MQELLGRITSLDPEASESLKVIGYFDALIEAHATAELLLRGAVLLSGRAAGYAIDGTVVRLGDDGTRTPSATQPARDDWPSHPISDDSWTWIEREGAPHANDAMVLERLALGLSITLERSHPVAIARRSLDVLLDTESTARQRAAAAGRLKLDHDRTVRMIAVAPGDAPETSNHSVVLSSPVGPLRAVLDTGEARGMAAGRQGLGIPATPDALRSSWDSAVIALRLTSARQPIVDAGSLGSVLLLAQAAETAVTRQPDVAALGVIEKHDERAIDQLEAITASDSLRSAAVAAGVHHSTLQAHAIEWNAALGFDLRSPSGRVRLALALALYRLATFALPS